MFTQGLTFDDILLKPKHSTIKSRSDVDLSVELPRGFQLDIPIVSANMKTVTGWDMAVTLALRGGMPVLHRFCEDPVQQYKTTIESFDTRPMKAVLSVAKGEAYVESKKKNIAVSLGIKDTDIEQAMQYAELGCKAFCVDVAHGDHKMVIEFVKKLRYEIPYALIIAGNVATATGGQNLWKAGADIIKIGIGPGSLCTTRVETGNGVPQVTAIMEVSNAWYKPRESDNELNRYPMFIADGGIKTPGDCVKALCFTDLVMLGNMLAGTKEAPGNVVSFGGTEYKEYAGSSTHKQQHIEGVIGLVPFKGKMEKSITRIKDGLSSGCSYQGAKSVKDLQTNPEFYIISGAGLRESHPHDVKL